MTLLDSLERAVARISEGGHRCALVGGLAVSAHATPRFTRDADLAVAVTDDEQAESVIRALVGAGYSTDALLEQEDVGRLSGVRLLDPDGVSVDLLFASSGIERELVQAAEPIEILEGVTVPVAGVGHLIALKLLSVDENRATDRADLRSLGEVATDQDWSSADDAVRMITRRGFNRDRDLSQLLTELRASHP